MPDRNAGLHIFFTNIENDDFTKTVVRGSSFHDCLGYCVSGENAHNVELDNNVFYKGESFLISALKTK